jgi:hypothetical protein
VSAPISKGIPDRDLHRRRLVKLLEAGKADEAEAYWSTFMRLALTDPLFSDDHDLVVSSRSTDESFIPSATRHGSASGQIYSSAA